jgi:hypothetical protein
MFFNFFKKLFLKSVYQKDLKIPKHINLKQKKLNFLKILLKQKKTCLD